MPVPTYLGLAITPRNITIFYLSKRKTYIYGKKENHPEGGFPKIKLV